MSEHRKPMDSKQKHPFQIVCRNCGSNIVRVVAFEFGDMEFICENCGFTLSCGEYHTMKGNYTGAGFFRTGGAR